MSGESLQEVRTKLNELLEAAKTGAIIPVRLPAQIEEITALLDKAEAEEQEQQVADVPADMADYMTEEAYFVGHAVHELRTPMTSIRGYADMLGSMGELNDMQKQFLDVIKNNSRRMESLLKDVSFVNKLRKGTLKVQAKMDMFKNIAMKIEKEMAPVAEELNRKLEFDIPQGLPILNIDGDLLSEALKKLVENGLRYSAEGEGHVKVSAEANDSDLVIIVADNGIGMSESDIEQLGTIYFRADHDDVRAHKGSGLGISIAYGMIELIGGKISVESQPDEGTRFTVVVPGMT